MSERRFFFLPFARGREGTARRHFQLVVLVLLALAARAAGGDGVSGIEVSGRGSRPHFWVTLCDSTGLEAATLERLRKEVSRIFSASDIDLLWRTCEHLNRTERDKAYEARAYILSRLPTWLQNEGRAASRRTLAQILSSPGDAPGPVIYVSRGAVEHLVSGSPSVSSSPKLAARALGRVLAHELAHRFLKRPDHTFAGILRTKFSSQELVGRFPKEFYFTKEERQLLHSFAEPQPARATVSNRSEAWLGRE